MWEHGQHENPIRTIHCNGEDLFVSTDLEKVIISNYRAKHFIRTVYIDQVNPSECMFQSA